MIDDDDVNDDNDNDGNDVTVPRCPVHAVLLEGTGMLMDAD